MLHWALVAAIAAAWLSTLGWGFAKLHGPVGYVALATVGLRLLLGFVGSHYARFKQFVRPPRVVLGYARELLTRSESRYLGHNPLGGWMVLTLLICIVLTGFTGWLFTTDLFWGTYWLKQLHLALAWTLLYLIALHVCGVWFTGRRHHENLVQAMLTGNKQIEPPSIKHPPTSQCNNS